MSASTASSTSAAVHYADFQRREVDQPRAVDQLSFGQCSAVGHAGEAGQRRAVSHLTAVPGAPTVSGAAARPGKPPRLRLTRRGRIVLIGLPLILLAALILSLAGLLNSPAKAADNASGLTVTPAVSVTVQPGESLWAIAGRVDPDRDPRDVIADIVQLNDLQAGKVMPGQQLFVPNK
jgi:LysM repeat protein